MKIISSTACAARTCTCPARRWLGAAPGRADRPGDLRLPASPSGCCAPLPGLAEHHCAAGVPGGFVSRLVGGTYFGHIAEHVAIELSQPHRPRGQLRPHRGRRRARRIRRDHRVPARRAAGLRASPRRCCPWRRAVYWRRSRRTGPRTDGRAGRRPAPTCERESAPGRAPPPSSPRPAAAASRSSGSASSACCASATAGTAGWCGPR